MTDPSPDPPPSPRLRIVADHAGRLALPPDVDLVGRDVEAAELLARLEEPGALVSVIGPPGAGKSALVNATVREALAGGRLEAAVWVSVQATLSHDELVARLVRSVGGSRTGAGDALATVAATLRGLGDVALVVDGAERSRQTAVPVLDSLLADVPLLRAVVTSREPLRSAGEVAFRIGPLEASAAVELFCRRVADRRRRGRAAALDVDAVGALVDRLDRLPLAIELAAARGGVLSVHDIARRLDERFRLLRARPGESRLGMEAALAWSWEMLEPWERSALNQATVFHGDFTLAAAEAVIDLSDWPGAPWTMDVVDALFERSLLRVEHGEGGRSSARYALYASMQDYAIAEGVSVERDAARDRHAQHYLSFAKDASAAIAGAEESDALAAFDADRANILAALEHRVGVGGELAGRAVLDTELLLSQRLTHRAHLAWLGRAIAEAVATPAPRLELGLRARRAAEILLRRYEEPAPSDVARAEELLAPDTPPELRFAVCHARGYERHMGGAPDEALAVLAEGRAVAAAAGRDADVGRSWLVEGMAWGALGDRGGAERNAHYRRAREAYGRALSVFESRRAQRFCAAIYGNIGNLHMRSDERAEQRYRFEQALHAARTIQHRYLESVSCANLAWGFVVKRDAERARELLDEALEIQRGVGRPVVEAVVHLRRGVLEADLGHWDAAVSRFVTAREVASLARAGTLASDASWWLALLAWHNGRDVEASSRVGDALDDAAGAAGRALVARHLASLVRPLAGDDTLPSLDAESVPHVVAPDVLERLFDSIRHALATHDAGPLTQLVPCDAAGAVATTWLPTARVLASAALTRLGARTPTGARYVAQHAELVVGPSLAWLEVPGRARVSLTRRRVVRRVARALVAARRERPGETVSVMELVEAGWPGEVFVGDSAANRVYVTIATLRQVGLGDALQTVSGGYRLDPSRALVEVDGDVSASDG